MRFYNRAASILLRRRFARKDDCTCTSLDAHWGHPFREEPAGQPFGLPSTRVKPFRDGLVVRGVECMFAWYWLADLCEREKIPFVLGHALAMRAIHGGKTKTDKIDAAKLAGLLRGGVFPQAYVYPKAKRATRDLLRRRSIFVRQRAHLIAHIQNTNSQYNLPPFAKKLTYAGNRNDQILDRFEEDSTKKSVEADLNMIVAYDGQLQQLETHLTGCLLRGHSPYPTNTPPVNPGNVSKSNCSGGVPLVGMFLPR